MGSVVDAIPVVSQVKSAIQAATGDTDGARQTQERFLRTSPGTSQLTSAIQAIQGDTEGARKTQEAFLEVSIKAVKIALLPVPSLLGTLKARRPISTKLTPRPGWMGSPGVQSLCLHELLLPGTHDSVTFTFKEYTPAVLELAQAQNQTIRQQLDGGIRYLDIRLQWVGTTIYCGHKYTTVPFQTVIDDVASFLETNRTEKVVINVDWDESGGYPLIDAARKLADTRLSGRYVQRATLAKPLALWGDEALLWLRRGCLDWREVFVNSWGDTQSPDPETAVKNCANWARGRDRTVGQLNLLACQATPVLGEATITNILTETDFGLSGLAERANHEIAESILTDARVIQGSNVINMDFADDGLIGAIVDLNPKTLTDAGYKSVDEGGAAELLTHSYVAYGVDTRYHYGIAAPGLCRFNPTTFNGDPAYGVVKKGYHRASSLIPDGPFRFEGAPDIYVMLAGVAWHIPNPETFTAMGYTDHAVFPAALKARVLLSGDFEGVPFRGSGDQGAWVLASGKRWHITEQSTLDGMNVPWDAMIVLPDPLMAAIPSESVSFEQVPFKGSGPAIYAMEGGRKRHIQTADALARHFPGRAFVTISDSILDLMAAGDPLV